MSGLTARQQEMVDYLREHGPTRGDVLADALGSTLRGIGQRYSALLWADGPRLVTRRYGNDGIASDVYSAVEIGEQHPPDAGAPAR